MRVVRVVERDRGVAGGFADDPEGKPGAGVDAFDDGGFVIDGDDDRAIGGDDAVMLAGGGKAGFDTQAAARADRRRAEARAGTEAGKYSQALASSSASAATAIARVPDQGRMSFGQPRRSLFGDA